MVYTSLTSLDNQDFRYDIKIAHLYGDLMNTYGDNGNVLMLKYVAEKLGARVQVDIVSLEDGFDKDSYDIVFFGGGQDYEQSIVKNDLIKKKDEIVKYIENNGLFLAICGGYQLLGKYYYDAYGNKIDGLSIFDHYTVNQDSKNRFTGQIKIQVESFDEICLGFENHGGRTFLSDKQNAFGKVLEGNGNNGEDNSEGFIYKNTIGTYLHGPILARNENLCKKIIEKIFKENNYDVRIKTKN